MYEEKNVVCYKDDFWAALMTPQPETFSFDSTILLFFSVSQMNNNTVF